MMLKLILIYFSGVVTGGIFAVIFICCLICAGRADRKYIER